MNFPLIADSITVVCWAVIIVMSLVLAWRLRGFPQAGFKALGYAVLALGSMGLLGAGAIHFTPWRILVVLGLFGVQMTDYCSVPMPQHKARRRAAVADSRAK